jgi:two-component sensor histidine kinase
MAVLLLLLIVVIIAYRTRLLKNKNTQLEQIVSDRTKELQRSLNQQKAMLQEIHHRVKNNLQFIEAIINMQINISKEEVNQNILQDINRRINAMTLVHEMLYNKESLETISVKHYIAELIKKLRGIVDGKLSTFEFNDQIDDIQLDINTCMALGMITTELVSNSLKYGFVEDRAPAISIQLKKTKKDNAYLFRVRDNGPGLPEGKLNNGLGMRLIDIFTRQLRGKHSFRNDDGLLFTLEMTIAND